MLSVTAATTEQAACSWCVRQCGAAGHSPASWRPRAPPGTDAASTPASLRPDRAPSRPSPAESVDYAVMENAPTRRTSDIRMVPWTRAGPTTGAWDAVAGRQQDAANVTRRRRAQHAGHAGAYRQPPGQRHRPARRGRVVVRTPDAVLVADRSRSRDVKHIVGTCNRPGAAGPRCPPGAPALIWYDSTSTPAARSSASWSKRVAEPAKHHRAEHWMRLVSGAAGVTNGDQVTRCSAEQSTYIPLDPGATGESGKGPNRGSSSCSPAATWANDIDALRNHCTGG